MAGEAEKKQGFQLFKPKNVILRRQRRRPKSIGACAPCVSARNAVSCRSIELLRVRLKTSASLRFLVFGVVLVGCVWLTRAKRQRPSLFELGASAGVGIAGAIAAILMSVFGFRRGDDAEDETQHEPQHANA